MLKQTPVHQIFFNSGNSSYEIHLAVSLENTLPPGGCKVKFMPYHHSAVDKQMQNDHSHSVQLIRKQMMPLSRKFGKPVSLQLSNNSHVCWANETVMFGFLVIGRDDASPYSLYHQQEDKSPHE